MSLEILKDKYSFKTIRTTQCNTHIYQQLQRHKEQFRWLLKVQVVQTTHQVVSEERLLSHSMQWYMGSSRTRVAAVPLLLQLQIRSWPSLRM